MPPEPPQPKSTLDKAAETVGRVAGQVVSRVEEFVARHPDPVDEARDALAEGRQRLGEIAGVARTRAAAAVDTVQDVVSRARATASSAAATARKAAKRTMASRKRTAKRPQAATRRTASAKPARGKTRAAARRAPAKKTAGKKRR